MYVRSFELSRRTANDGPCGECIKQVWRTFVSLDEAKLNIFEWTLPGDRRPNVPRVFFGPMASVD